MLDASTKLNIKNTVLVLTFEMIMVKYTEKYARDGVLCA